MEPTILTTEPRRIPLTTSQSSYLKEKSSAISQLKQQLALIEQIAKAHEEGVQMLMSSLGADNTSWSIQNISGEDFLVGSG